MLARVEFGFRGMTDTEGNEINSWRWPGVMPDRPELRVSDDAYTARDESGALVGYCAFGSIRELDTDRYVVVAGGLRPSLVGRGNGHKFMEAILLFGRQRFPGKVVAGVIKRSNPRSKSAALAAGFVVLCDADDDGEGEIVADGAAS